MAGARASGGRHATGDTIAAIATANGASGIGIVRISGADAAPLARSLTRRGLLQHKFHFCTFYDAAGAAIDRGLALRFRAPRSYTGEDVVELHAHGNPVLLDLLLRRVLELGARLARPGEFTERAFLNGKLDLAQAEAVADLIAATSQAGVRAAQRSLDGAFSREIGALFKALVQLRAWIEAALDFVEEEIDFLEAPQLHEQLAALRERSAELLAVARRGLRLRDGLHVVIVGPPNAGKSSLLNALARSERAIVTAIPGTTRDLLRESLNVDGVELTLVDTAGLRESSDPVEREGVARARAELARADVALLVLDCSAGAARADDLLAPCADDVVRIVVHNKIDLSGEPAHVERCDEREIHVHLSAQRGDGLVLLRAELVRLAGHGDGSEGAFSARRRHVVALETVQQRLAAVHDLLGEQRCAELAAEELRLAQRALGEITGEYSSDDLLGAIFSTFCIGK